MNLLERGLAAAMTAALLGVLALGSPAAGQGSDGRGEPRAEVVPSLVVAGRGEVREAPDEAAVRLGVLAQAATAGAAQQQANQTVTALLRAVRGLGVREEQIRTSELSLSPVYAPVRPQAVGAGEEPQGPRIVGYQASNSVTVTLDKLDQVGAVVDAGLGAGANRLEGVAFGLRHDEAARQAALRDAAAQARGKAAALAAAMHVRLVEVLEVQEEGTAVPQPRFEAMRMSAGGAALATPVSAGQVEVSAAVTLRYRIAPCPAQGGCGETP
ncbi:MAG TPA: SIMPL domain-containing protein [Thermoanaerobaculia bacterium]